jgi:hypothetical protein
MKVEMLQLYECVTHWSYVTSLSLVHG